MVEIRGQDINGSAFFSGNYCFEPDPPARENCSDPPHWENNSDPPHVEESGDPPHWND